MYFSAVFGMEMGVLFTQYYPDANPKPAQLGGGDRGSRFHRERRVRFKLLI
jgi:hypothetical protein